MKSQGNVFLYVLIAIGLLAALTFAISKSNDHNPQTELDAASASTAATSILAYEAQARMAITQMIQNGSSIDSILFTLPSNASFNTAPTINKLFHVDGGGLQWKQLSAAAKGGALISPVNGFYIGKVANIEWTPTSTVDYVFIAYGINNIVCKEINRKLTGSATITSIGDLRSVLVPATASGIPNVNFVSAPYPTIAGKSAYCLGITPANNQYAFYSIIAAR